MTKHRLFNRLRDSSRGATTAEFALILIPLCIMLFGSLEMGYRIYAESVLNGALREAARMASTGSYTGTQIDNQVRQRITDFRRDATTTIIKKSYVDFTGVGVAEPITSGTIDSGNYCFSDVNGNGVWDEDQGKSGLGGAEDVVYYEVDMSYNSLFAFSIKALGLNPITSLSANTLVSNEPFAAVVRTTPPTKCVP